MLRSFALAACLVALPVMAPAKERPILWGYGNKACPEFAVAYDGWKKGDDAATGELLRYRDWLAGFVSALSLATGEAVLHGTDLEPFMGDVRKQCDQQHNTDFFNATMAVIRALSLLK